MYLDEILAAQKRGEARGIVSVCSAHPRVIGQTLKTSRAYELSPLIEATCNQVNQFGGYTGMTPPDFVRFVHRIAETENYPFENIILGGDHLGPSVWQSEPAEVAMAKAMALVHGYVEAGFAKIHLDCSMRLADDPESDLEVEVSAERTAQLAGIAEQAGGKNIRYVIGTEVPTPGGATEYEQGVGVTAVEDVRRTIEVTRAAFYRAGLQSAWERVTAVVVQPGVEFGDDFVLPYQPDAAQGLAGFIETQPLVYEAHSTDYQTRQALRALVRDHFAILKVGPALTFAFREAVFALAMMEDELLPVTERSNFMACMDDIMLEHPEYWIKYYHGDESEKAFKRKYSFSDRIRYYWSQPAAKAALDRLMANLNGRDLPLSLISQFLPAQFRRILMGELDKDPEALIHDKIAEVLRDYVWACTAGTI